MKLKHETNRKRIKSECKNTQKKCMDYRLKALLVTCLVSSSAKQLTVASLDTKCQDNDRVWCVVTTSNLRQVFQLSIS